MLLARSSQLGWAALGRSQLPGFRYSAHRWVSSVDDKPDYDAKHLFPQPGSYTPSRTEPIPATGRPIPLNVEMTRYAPLKLPVQHGDRVAEVTVATFYGTKDLDFYTQFLMRAAFYLGIPVRGPTPLPKKRKRWTVIRSPFVHAKSKQNFERITYRRQFACYDANPETVQVLLSVAKKYPMAGVGVKANVYTHESATVVNSMDLPSDLDRQNPLAVNKVHIDARDGEVAQKVLDLLKDPRFASENSELPSDAKSAVIQDKASKGNGKSYKNEHK